MTQESQQLEAQSLESIAAWCKDQSVQLEYCHKEKETWHTKDSCPAFDLSAYYYRIAKPSKWYRVGKDKYDTLFIVQDESEELKYEAMPLFKCWLPEGRKYYD